MKIKVGEVFSRLTVISEGVAVNKRFMTHLCRCECGKEVVVRASSLLMKNTRSCGCYSSEILAKRNFKHGFANKKIRLYGIWNRMKQRCINPNTDDYARYGGRGITVCDEWFDFMSFYSWSLQNGYDDNLSIDRINNDKGYSPDNCKWDTSTRQARNKSTNHLIEYNGQTKTLAEWGEIYGLETSLIRYRLKHWPKENLFINATK